MTADAARASVARGLRMSGQGRSVASLVAGLEASGPRTLAITLTGPCSRLPARRARPQGACILLLPAAEAETEGRIDRPADGGLCRMVWDARVQGAQVVFERFEGDAPPAGAGAEDRFQSVPKIACIERIARKIIPDRDAAFAAIQAGEFDGIETVSQDVRPILEMTPGVALQRADIPAVAVMRFNPLHAPFDDLRVRHAVLLGVKPSDFMSVIGYSEGDGSCSIAMGAFAPGAPVPADRGLRGAGDHDLEAARAALTEAWAFGARVALVDPVRIPILHAMTPVGADLRKKNRLRGAGRRARPGGRRCNAAR